MTMILMKRTPRVSDTEEGEIDDRQHRLNVDSDDEDVERFDPVHRGIICV